MEPIPPQQAYNNASSTVQGLRVIMQCMVESACNAGHMTASSSISQHCCISKNWHCLLLFISCLLWGSKETAAELSQMTDGGSNNMKETVDSTCRLESFYIVEVNAFAKRAKVPLCDADKMFRVSTRSGQIFIKDTEESTRHNASAMHFFGTYAAPWFLYQGIADSPYQTRDKSRAGLFYVNDYCYYMWWLAAAESKDYDGQSPGAYLVKIYEEILESPMWKQRNGQDFVFFLPWSIAHVLEYERRRPDSGVIQSYIEVMCNSMQPALQITVENLQGRNMCKHGRDKKALVAPFVPNVVDIKGQALMESLTSMQHDVHGYQNRTILVYFKGRCAHHTQSPSRLLRSHVAAALADEGEDFNVRCVEKEPTGRVPFENLLADMEKSIFCLVLPETGQSARLLSEVMMAGCIPVFLGPPFAAMPFQDDLDYSLFSLIIRLTDLSWVEESTAKTKGLGSAEEALQTVEGLVADAELKTVAEIADFLRKVPLQAKIDGLNEVQKVQRSFIFTPELDAENPSAVDLLTLNLCRRMNQMANSLQEGSTTLRRSLAETIGRGFWDLKHRQPLSTLR